MADRLHSAAIHLLRRVRRADESTGISPARLSALSVLVFGGPRSLGELAEAEQVRPPTMSRVVRYLTEDGWVHRRTDPGDTRKVRLSATPAGRRFLEAGRRRRIGHLESILAGLRPAELRCLAEAAGILERLLGPARETNPPKEKRNDRSGRTRR